MALAATADEWITLHARYRTDSVTLAAAGNFHSALYLAGYVAEAAAKALSIERNPVPLNTHSLAALFDRAKMPLAGLSPEEHRYVMSREVALRYELELPTDWEGQLESSQRVAQRLYGELQRRRRRGRR